MRERQNGAVIITENKVKTPNQMLFKSLVAMQPHCNIIKERSEEKGAQWKVVNKYRRKETTSLFISYHLLLFIYHHIIRVDTGCSG